MLILSRRPEEEILIVVGGKTVTVKVISCSKKTVQIGFQAPPDVTIVRPELLRENHKEQHHGLERPAPRGPVCPS